MQFVVKSIIKRFVVQVLLTGITGSLMIISSQQDSLADVNTSFLTKSVESCNRDVLSAEYYERAGVNMDKLFKFMNSQSNENFNEYLMGECIQSRYVYLLTKSKFPWLDSKKDAASGYSEDIMMSLLISRTSVLAAQNSNLDLLKCVITKNSSSNECGLINVFFENLKHNITSLYSLDFNSHIFSLETIYTCPSCIIANKTNPLSSEENATKFTEWFLSLDKLKRREVVSILGDSDKQISNMNHIYMEVAEVVPKYNQIRTEILQQEENRKKKDILGY